jgi:flagellar basal body-associated protein FliL
LVGRVPDGYFLAVLWIIVIVILVVLLLGGFGYSRRR